jgi:septal ring factor EnvC (AmiA/AmiB activator)
MLEDLEARIDSINARNDLLARLTSALKTQIDKTNKDANLLKQIKDGVDKATKTVTEIRSLINQLTATDAGTKDKLSALVVALDEISSIFQPQTT